MNINTKPITFMRVINLLTGIALIIYGWVFLAANEYVQVAVAGLGGTIVYFAWNPNMFNEKPDYSDKDAEFPEDKKDTRKYDDKGDKLQ